MCSWALGGSATQADQVKLMPWVRGQCTQMRRLVGTWCDESPEAWSTCYALGVKEEGDTVCCVLLRCTVFPCLFLETPEGGHNRTAAGSPVHRSGAQPPSVCSGAGKPARRAQPALRREAQPRGHNRHGRGMSREAQRVGTTGLRGKPHTGVGHNRCVRGVQRQTKVNGSGVDVGAG